ncbi:MAG: HAMP domain-containing histidine kinase [Gemmatimonadaceae bacterium]|nr:HAMP domain-containing histidine kinase [Gemmatimonadaceae bacterium]
MPTRSGRGLPLRVRLVLSLGALGLILTTPLIVARASLTRLYADIEALQARDFRASLVLGQLRAISDVVKRGDDQVVGLHDSTGVPGMIDGARQLRQLADSLRTLCGNECAIGIDTATAEVERYVRLSVSALDARDFERVDAISPTLIRPSLQRLIGAVGDAEVTLRSQTSDRVRRARDEVVLARNTLVTGLAVAVLFAAIVGWWIVRSIARPVDDLDAGMQRIAAGHFDHELTVASRRNDEFGRLAESYALMAVRLGELDQLKAEFVSMASHELKTPLNVIQGYLTLLDEGVYGPLSERQREAVHTIERQSHALNRLVRQLLDVSRYDAGGAALAISPVDVRDFFGEVQTAFVVLADQRGLRFDVTVARDVPGETWWDRQRMMEAVGNLVTNACKFTPRGGVVAVHVAAEAGAVRIEVRDTGVGIPASELPHVFRKFFQAGNQEGAAHAGTGLGLAIVRGIVEAHGGSVHVTSDVGVGSTFTIRVPARATVERRLAAAAPSVAGVSATTLSTA